MPLTQALSAVLLCLAGFAFGLAFDLYRVLRRLSNPGRIMTVVCDLLFWLVYAIWIFVLLLRTNAGEVRYHVFVSIVAGASFYFWLFSKRLASAWYIIIYRLMRAVNRVADWLSRALDVGLKVVLWPYRMLVRWLVRPLWRVVTFLLSPVLLLLGWIARQVHTFGGWLTRPLRRWSDRARRALARILTPPTKES